MCSKCSFECAAAMRASGRSDAADPSSGSEAAVVGAAERAACAARAALSDACAAETGADAPTPAICQMGWEEMARLQGRDDVVSADDVHVHRAEVDARLTRGRERRRANLVCACHHVSRGWPGATAAVAAAARTDQRQSAAACPSWRDCAGRIPPSNCAVAARVGPSAERRSAIIGAFPQ